MKINQIYFCLFAILVLCSNTLAYDDSPIVVLREDDGQITCKDVFPEFGNKSFLAYGKELNIPITWGVITQYTAKGIALSWADLNDYVANTTGSELASHSANHKAMNSLQEYIDDVMLSISDFQNNTLYPCNTFLQPGTWTGDAFLDSFGKWDSLLGQAIENTFRQSQEYISGVNCLGTRSYMFGNGADYDIDYRSTLVPDDFLKAMDYVAKIPGYIYVIQFHGMQSPTGTLSYHTRTNFMAALLVKLDAMRDDGTIRLLSLNDAYSNNNFSPDINRVYDSGFEYYNADLKQYLTLSMVGQLDCGRIGAQQLTVWAYSSRQQSATEFFGSRRQV